MSSRLLIVLQVIAIFSVPFVTEGSSVKDIPLAEITEQTDFWVRGRIVSIEINPLSEDERHRFNSQGDTEVKIVIELVDAIPHIEETRITVHWSSTPERLQRVKVNEECIAALIRQDDGTYKSLGSVGFFGWYQPDPKTGLFPSVGGNIRNVPPQLAWDLVSTLRLGPESSSGVDKGPQDKWLSRLKDGTLAEFSAAQVVLDAFPEQSPTPEILIAACEEQYANFQVGIADQAEPYDAIMVFQRSLPITFNLLERIGDSVSTSRLIEFYERDLGSQYSVFDDHGVPGMLINLICARGGDTRTDHLRRLIGKQFTWTAGDNREQKSRTPIEADHIVLSIIAESPGGDIDALLIEMLGRPADFTIADSGSLAGVWRAMAMRGQPEIKTYLDELVANPDSFNLGVRREESRQKTLEYARTNLTLYSSKAMPRSEHIRQMLSQYESGDFGILSMLFRSISKTDSEWIPKLASIPPEHLKDRNDSMENAFSEMTTRTFPDPVFLPQLRVLVQTNQNGYVLEALTACGDEELARKIAMGQLTLRPTSGDWRGIYDAITKQTGIVLFLGKLEDPELEPIILPFTQQTLIEGYREILIAAAEAENKDPYDFEVRSLEKCAILALARAGGSNAVPRLREIYRDGDIGARIAAAMGLYALGDDTGSELVVLFEQHRELENEEIAARWRVDISGDFHHATRYLENPRLDAVLLNRLKQGFGEGDHDVVSYEGFVNANKSMILPALADNLDHENPRLRRDADRLLRQITRQKFDFDPDKSPRNQAEAIANWRAWLNAHS
ncbi:MAG: HEAT repeat domain-containing protein [Candidatus Hydrogenedentes bacterium]|nr:HEAT repeat domain-containing protein [Candidatus Hydrogenedentota bacterium]